MHAAHAVDDLRHMLVDNKACHRKRLLERHIVELPNEICHLRERLIRRVGQIRIKAERYPRALRAQNRIADRLMHDPERQIDLVERALDGRSAQFAVAL